MRVVAAETVFMSEVIRHTCWWIQELVKKELKKVWLS